MSHGKKNCINTAFNSHGQCVAQKKLVQCSWQSGDFSDVCESCIWVWNDKAKNVAIKSVLEGT
jgi:hypothetical protein